MPDLRQPSSAEHHAARVGRRAVTVGLVAAIAVLAAGTALTFFGAFGVVMLVVGGVMAGRVQQRTSSAAVLRALGARPLMPWEAPSLHRAIGELTRRAGLPDVPQIALLPGPSLNALATGSGTDGVVAVTPSLLRSLSPRQLFGVLAHELSHIRATDLRVMGIASTLARFTQTIALVGTVMLLLFGPAAMGGQISTPMLLGVLWAPNLATLLLLALSRQREFHADADAVRLTGDAEGLAQALLVLDHHGGAMWETAGRARATPPAWLRTHPTTEARVARLRHMAGPTRSADLWEDRADARPDVEPVVALR